jgi:hypothetical protein
MLSIPKVGFFLRRAPFRGCLLFLTLTRYADWVEIDADVAHNCLQSVPNYHAPAAKLIESLKAFVQWQSTLAWLKNPPVSYDLSAVDILGGLDNLTRTVTTGGFSSEYNFQVALVELLESAHDYHLSYNPDLLRVFWFLVPELLDLISVSSDGKELPRLYHEGMYRNQGELNLWASCADTHVSIDHVATVNGTTFTGPALAKINGQDAVTFLEQLNLKHSGFQDRDAQWNAQFASYSRPIGKYPIVAMSEFFQGRKLILTYEDGTQREVTRRARVSREKLGDFATVVTGKDFYNQFCHPEPTNLRQLTKQLPNGLQPPAGMEPRRGPLKVDGEDRNWKHDEFFLAPYPPAVVRDGGFGATAGFFMNDEGYEDVAVLAVPTFMSRAKNPALQKAWLYSNDFQKTVGDFLELCKEARKQRLVIDLTGNRGGKITGAYELFAQVKCSPHPHVLRRLNVAC